MSRLESNLGRRILSVEGGRKEVKNRAVRTCSSPGAGLQATVIISFFSFPAGRCQGPGAMCLCVQPVQRGMTVRSSVFGRMTPVRRVSRGCGI